MTDEEIMTRIAMVFGPVDPDGTAPDDRTAMSARVRRRAGTRNGFASLSEPDSIEWVATLAFPHGEERATGGTQRDALLALLRKLAVVPLTMAQHDALQALRVEVGL